MPVRSANLEHFLLLTQFVSAKAHQYIGLEEIQQELTRVAPLFKANQLDVKIFSRFPLLFEGLKLFFDTHQGLRQFYNSKISDLSNNSAVTSSHPSPTLILKGNSVVGQSEERYQLSSTQSLLIGRDLQHQNDARTIHIPGTSINRVSRELQSQKRTQ